MQPLIILPPDRQLPSGLASSTEEEKKPAWMMSAVTLSAHGHGLMDISKSLNQTVGKISEVLKSDWGRMALVNLVKDFDIAEAPKKALNASAMDAVVCLQSLMLTSGSDQVKLKAAVEILDRTIGKPLQRNANFNSATPLDPKDEMDALEAKLKLQKS